MAAAITTCFEIRIEFEEKRQNEQNCFYFIVLIEFVFIVFLSVIQSVFIYKPTVGQLMPSILMAELDVLDVCDDSDTLDGGTSDVNGSDDM